MTSTPAVIGALRVVLGADTAQLESAFKDAVDKADKFGKAMSVAAGGAVAAVAAIGAAVGAAVVGSLSSIDKLAKTAQQIGVPVEQLSALKFAADQSGVSIDTLGQGFKDLATKMTEAVGDNQSGPARAFAALGVAVTDAQGKLRDSQAVFLDVADRFSKVRDGANKTALAVQMFGDSGARMIPLLNQGSDGIARLGDEAKSLGLIIDSNTAAAAERFMTNLEQLRKSKDALVQIISARLAPTLDRLSERFATYVKDAAKSEEVTSLLTGSFKVLVSALEVVSTGINILGIIWKRFKESIASPETTDQAVAGHLSMWEEIKAAAFGGMKEIQAIWNGWAPTVTKAADQTVKAMAPMIESGKQMAERLAIARAELNALVSAPTDEFAQKMIAIEQATKKGIIPLSQNIALTNQVLGQMRTEARAVLDELVNAPLETYSAKVKAIGDAYADNIIKQREFAKMMKSVNDQNVENMQALASAVSSALTTIFGKSKAAAIAAAVINTAQAVTKNLAQYPMPFGGIMAGLAVATGAAQIAAIKSSSLSGGGSAPRSVPSAAAPSDTSDPGAGAGGGLNQTLTVQGLDAGALF
ncbi:MAG TPA: phage tail tape measure protein, partial [Beijerinckiaceae bacterium]|nr:phage tail tape measure protein [Beijerinckiaceae bacterium]